MNRREALKKLGVTFGLAVTGPALFRSFETLGYSKSPSIGIFKPQFFTEAEFMALTAAVDVILPATDSSPSASEVGVPQYIDGYADKVMDLDERDMVKDFASRLANKAANTDMEDIVEAALNPSEEDEQMMYDQIRSYEESKRTGGRAQITDDVAIFSLMNNLRGMAISSYKNSEYVGEQVLAYDPVPGRQEGCVSVEEATGGKAWSL